MFHKHLSTAWTGQPGHGLYWRLRSIFDQLVVHFCSGVHAMYTPRFKPWQISLDCHTLQPFCSHSACKFPDGCPTSFPCWLMRTLQCVPKYASSSSNMLNVHGSDKPAIDTALTCAYRMFKISESGRSIHSFSSSKETKFSSLQWLIHSKLHHKPMYLWWHVLMHPKG